MLTLWYFDFGLLASWHFDIHVVIGADDKSLAPKLKPFTLLLVQITTCVIFIDTDNNVYVFLEALLLCGMSIFWAAAGP